MIDLRQILSDEAVQNKHGLCSLLFNNYRINFPETVFDLRYVEEKIQGMIQYLQEEKAIVFGAFDDSQLIGFVWGFERHFFNEKRFHLNELIVAEEHRGRKIGRQLVGMFIDAAKRRNIQVVDLFCMVDNANAIRFYQKMDFEIERYQMCLNLTK